MAGTGSSYALEKGLLVASDYNTSNVNGVQKYRIVRFSPTVGQEGKIDVNLSGLITSLGVVQEDVDRAKVATGKAVANVRVIGISRVVAEDATPTLGTRAKIGAAGGVVAAAAGGDKIVGIVVGAPTPAPAAGDIVEILLTPGATGN